MLTTTSGTAPGSIRTHPLPPEGFDPRGASPLELVRYGLPRRPDPAVIPRLAARWDEVFSRKLTYITPTFQPMEELLPGFGQRDRPQPDANTNESNWSGSVVTATADKFNLITGQWNVPDVSPAANVPFMEWWSATWIGIDGYGSKDVCQIGTVQVVDDSIGLRGSRAFIEWFPVSAQVLSNFSVSFGDTLTGLLCAVSPTEAVFNLVNLTNLVHTGFTFWAPAGTALAGNSAEWIVERPGVNGSISLLPSFGEVYFDSTIASTSSGDAQEAGTGTLLNMVENGTTVATTIVETPTLIKITYSG